MYKKKGGFSLPFLINNSIYCFTILNDFSALSL